MGFVGEKSDSSNLWDSLLVIRYWVSWGLLHCSFFGLVRPLLITNYSLTIAFGSLDVHHVLEMVFMFC
jgi:hypothetical protein